ncbi:DNA methyltransferase [Streptococcus suis]|uniref:Site-specific DNA-methyltransferase n=1 Tax=Streptococcus suis TaxID=1307 RepID=A0A3S6JMC3_STRSU|nr:site-specific DNA-methyltransferase [Streptococcus suis]ASW49949.1 restriction endonuclease subunit M [Streptococcus suis]KPA72386.1 restriction endonuclease subunit M [Streptococcus suis]NQM46715.1 site-specific DNA-methyltransferase [Streptococcus suis]HEL1780276.1 site-specific DNA-methyltransferase [Streptococcus suis]HEM2811115.1 site-specific DNA-methyltransferase [Streptococcus suis]
MKQELEQLLAQNDTFMVEGVLNKNKLAELARQYNPELLNILMSNDKISKHFFSTLDTGVLVFKKDVFLQFLNNKEFLPDSFTAYKTKIGLATGDKYLSENQEVVLNFPYKDCVLEGGQTKDDAKRQEIFFNETLAPTEINRLLDDKVLTNFKRYDETGEHEVEELSDTDNLIIKGNNLIALHSLKKRFAGKVKLIYIDPPYNTGNDSFQYNDNFNHSTWLTFMKNRLEVARELLSDRGVLFLSIDRNEFAELKVLLDEMFRDGYQGTVINVSAPNGRDYGNFAQTHDYIHIYSKNKEKVVLNQLDVDEEKFKKMDDIGSYYLHPLFNSNSAFHSKNRPNLYYPFYITEDCNSEGYHSLSIVRDEVHKIEVYPPRSQTDGTQFVWRWGKEKAMNEKYDLVAQKKSDGTYRIAQKMRPKKQIARTVWNETSFTNRRGTEELQLIFGEKVFLFPKPENLIKRIIEIATNEGDIVLDYHLGSGTTAAVAHKMNRQYIGIEQMDYIETVSVERLKKVIAGEQGGISKDVNWSGGGSFVYAELKNDAQDFKNAIFEATATEELLELFELAKKSSFLSYRIDPKKLKKNEFCQLSLAEQKQILSEIIDNNNLYVNYSDIDDSDYQISAEDKKLNHAFYGKEK